MPSPGHASRAKTPPNSTKSIAMSNHLWGSVCPIGTRGTRVCRGHHIPGLADEPWKMRVETDRAAITHPRRSNADHRAPQDAAADARACCPGFHLKLHHGTRQQSKIRFYQ